LSKLKFNEDDLVEILRLKNHEGLKSRAIAKVYGVSKSTINNFLSKLTYTAFWEKQEDKPIVSGDNSKPIEKRGKFTGKRFVFTSAQNNTYRNAKFVDTLLQYCEINSAELVVSTFEYNKRGDDAWYDSKLRPFVCNEQMQIAEELVWCGNLNISPTAANPLQGFKNYLGAASIIIPHTKLELDGVATPQADNPKIMYTTGCATLRNYIPKTAGQKSEWHHITSALVVEIDNEGDWFVRQLVFDVKSGTLQDLTTIYSPNGIVAENQTVAGLNLGDIHQEKITEEEAGIGWNNSDSIAAVLKPEYIMVHDIYDQARRNHHNLKDPYYNFQQFHKKKECVREEVLGSVNAMKDIAKHGHVIVVESNHDLALERWLKEADYKTDPVNSLFFLELQYNNYLTMSQGDKPQTFKMACETVNQGELYGVTFLKTDESFKIQGIECGQHGHTGSNGARGSITSFVGQGSKFNTGHGHTAIIKNGVWQSGAIMTAGRSGYAKGGSSWSFSNTITHYTGKRQMLTVRNGKWRALD